MSSRQGEDHAFEESRSYLPWLIAAAVLIFGTAQVTALRPQLAAALAVVLPVVAVTSGVFRFRSAARALETSALIVGGSVVVAAEVCVCGGLLQMQRFQPALPAARTVLVAGFLLALLLHTLAVRRGLNPRFGAWIGMTGAFGWLLSRYEGGDPFANVLVTGSAAVVVGGGAGLLAGEALRRFFRSS